MLGCWLLVAQRDAKNPNLGITNHDHETHSLHRHEVVTIMGEAPGAIQRKIFKIVRTDAGGFFGLTEWEGLPLAQFQGRFVDILAPKPPTPEVIEVPR